MALLSSSPKWPTLSDYFHDWALVDVETSGLRPGRDRVLSLAILTLDAHGNGRRGCSGTRRSQCARALNPELRAACRLTATCAASDKPVPAHFCRAASVSPHGASWRPQKQHRA